MNKCLTALGVIAVAFAMAGGFHLDDIDAATTTQQVVEDVGAQAEAVQKDSLNNTEAIADPRVQRSLRGMCRAGEAWACPLILNTGSSL